MSCTFPFHCIATTLLLALSVQEAPLPHQPLRLGRSDANAQGNAVVAICVDRAQPAWTLLYGVLPQDGGRPCARADMERVKQRDFPALQRRLHNGLLHEEQPEAGVAARVLGQAIAVENRVGASGMIGANALASARPDGYTIGQIPISVTRFSQLGTLAADPRKDYS